MMPVKIISLGDDFARWAVGSEESAAAGRALSFMKEVVSPNREYYEALVFDDIPAEDRRLKAAALSSEKYYEKRGEMAEAFGYTPAALRRLAAEFLDVFPDCAAEMTLVVMPSLRRFNGREKLVNGTAVAGFGVEYFCAGRYPDAAAREKELRLTAAHELFHLYHGAKSGIWQAPGAPVVTWLWAEGLAVYASKVLCPGATASDILMDEKLAAACAGGCAEAYKKISPALLSVSAEDLGNIFNGGRSYDGLPSRIGYAIGFLGVERLAERGNSLAEMSAWSPERATAELKAVLDSW